MKHRAQTPGGPHETRFGTQEELQQVLTGARCILWHAQVRIRPDGHPLWNIKVFNEEAAEKLHPLLRQPHRTYSDVWQEWTLPEDRKRIDENSEQALHAGVAGYTQEFRSRRADGQVRWLFEDARVQLVGPEEWLVVGVCTDITERKQMEEALRVSEARYRGIVEDQMDFVVRSLPDTTLTFANDSYCRFFGRTAGELIGHSFLAFIPESDRQAIKEAFARFGPACAMLSHEHRVTASDGRVRWHQWSNRAILDGEGRVIEVQGVGRDITDLKAAEEQQRSVSEGLRIVVATADRLIACPDLDTLCRESVELLRERLGVERCAIFLRHGDRLGGTFGTDRQGRTSDEHGHEFPATKEWIERLESLRLQARRMLVVRQPYHEWVGDRIEEFGMGWVAVTPIMAEREFLGVFCNDTAISGAPLDETRQEIIALFCSLLGAIIERKRVEGRHRAMSAGLQAILSIADELISCADLDTLYRRAVELAREKLGMERCGLFLLNGARLRGTYGTDRDGRTTPEGGHEVSHSVDWLKRFQAMREAKQRTLVFDQRYIEWHGSREEEFKYGWVAATPIQSATDLVGVFFNDAAITGAPQDETQQEIFSVYSSLLGAIIQRKTTENRLRAASVGLRAVVGIADDLISCPDLDTMYRRAVELARDKIGLERCSLFVPDGDQLRGTYGINCSGRTCDEHGHTITQDQEWLDKLRALRAQDRRTAVVEQPYVEWEDGVETKFGHGWIAVTPIQTAAGFLGVFCNDTAVTQAPMDDTKQEIVSVFCTLLGAVMEAKRAEAEIRLLAMAVQQEAEAVAIAGTNGTIQYVNPAFERMTGYSFGEVIGQNPRILKSGRQDAAFYEEMWKTLTAGQVWTGHFVNRKKDGTLYEIESTISPMRDEAGSIVKYVSTARDVTHEVQLEQQIRQAQKMDAIGRLAGGIAHDFNNLLTSVLGYTRLLRDQLGEGHPLQADVAEIGRAGERAANLTKQLLAFSRKQPIEARAIGLNAVVMDMDKLLRRTLGENIELVTVLDPEMGFVRADTGLIEQVIINLAVNARDAMPEGGNLTIKTEAVTVDEAACRAHKDVRPGRFVLLSARDTGIGMTEEVREQCFEPFFTSKPAGRGTGLGLSIVYGITKQFGGFIEIDTAPNAGTNVRVYFPAAKPPKEAPPPREEIELPRGTETVLVVEDEDTVRRLAVRILGSLGYTVLEAAHGGEALLICERYKEPIDLVLTDVVMPHIGGPETVKRLQQVRQDFKVLYMSGFTDDLFVQEEMGHHSPRFIAKPFTHEGLALKVRQALDTKPRARR